MLMTAFKSGTKANQAYARADLAATRSDGVARRLRAVGPYFRDIGMNVCSYVAADPINFVDPTGLTCVTSRGEGSSGSDGRGGVWVKAGRLNTVCWDGGDGIGGATSSGDGPSGGSGGEGTTTPQNDQDEEIVVTATKKVVRCAAEQFGLSDVISDAGLIAAGQPIPGSKPFVTKGSSVGTSLAGMAANRTFGKATLPIRMPTIVGGTPGSRLRIAGTKSVARFATRAVPVIGWALLAYDAASVAVCAATERE